MPLPRCIVLSFLLLPLAALPTEAAPTCVDATLCAGEHTQSCGGPASYGDKWDGFTGAWGNASGVEYGAGGWDRCLEGDWAAGVFVNMDDFPVGDDYQLVTARFDVSDRAARPCYGSFGLYGTFNAHYTYLCSSQIPRDAIPNPGWGSVLS